MILFRSLYCDNVSQEFVNAHRSVFNHFDIPIEYSRNDDHGTWLNKMMLTKDDPVMGFFDIDCIPLSKEKVQQYIDYAIAHDTFVGCAQASNHIPPYSHIFTAPCFFVITRSCWERIGMPSFKENPRCDVAENVCYEAEMYGQPYRAIYPDYFEAEPIEGVWYLHNYGIYGIGTTFDNTVYHLYQGRFPQNRARFIQRCNEVVNGTFSTQGFLDCKDMNYQGRMVR